MADRKSYKAVDSEIKITTKYETGQILIFDKPLNWTSFDLVNKIRIMLRVNLGIKKIKVGHSGTLDPLATGVMVVCTGKATKQITALSGCNKEYIAVCKLGETTPSCDLETQIDAHYPTSHITKEMVTEVLKSFIGKQQQVPPLHSAKFIDGKRAYEYARKGIEKELLPVEIEIEDIELLQYDMPFVTVRIRCSKGTYIRSFARDFGKALNSGACLTKLCRTAVGEYKLENAITLSDFEQQLQEFDSTT